LRLPRAALAAWRFRKVTGTSVRDLLREGWAMKRNQGLTWSQVALAANAPMLIRATMVEGRPEVGVLPTGQVTGVVDEVPTVAELLARIRAEAESTLKRLGAG
ncbi:MAG TPA: nitronate monooxygenase, partial [Acidimicrobiales bacterium]|nr:nitronate monooxygenase [Acidimicrobiales bacterium]